MPKQTYGIYLGLDEILDTRLATLYQHFGESVALKTASSPKYARRKEDRFENITKDEFKAMYNKRDKITLSHSVSTKLIPYIRETCLSVKYRVTASQQNKQPIIYLNLYPYKNITEEERSVIIDIFSTQFVEKTQINLIDMSYEQMDSNYVTSNFDIMFMYDYGRYIDYHIKDVEAKRFKSISLFGPTIFHNGIPDKDTEDKIKKTNITPFQLAEIGLSVAIDVKLIELQFFNANIAD